MSDKTKLQGAKTKDRCAYVQLPQEGEPCEALELLPDLTGLWGKRVRVAVLPCGERGTMTKRSLEPFGPILHKTGPHGAHEMELSEDAPKPADRIYVLRSLDSCEPFAGMAVGILGSELDDLLTWWVAEKKRAERREPSAARPKGGAGASAALGARE